MEILDHILSLLSEEEMVYVSGLGGFITKEVPSRLDSATNILYPPSKEVVFNDRLVAADTKLAELVSELEGCSLEEANQHIATFVDTVKKEISTHHKFHLEGVGTFYEEEGGLVFKDKLSPSADSQNFGLPSILIKHVQSDQQKKLFNKPKDRNSMSTLDLQSVPDPASPGDNSNQNRTEKKPEAPSSMTWLYVLTPIVLLGLFGVFLGITEDGKKMLASMHVIHTHVESDTAATELHETEGATEQATVTEETPAVTESFENTATAEETLKKSEGEKWGEEPTKSPQEKISKSTEVKYSTANIIQGKSGRFFVIVGGFAKKHNAVKLREKLVEEGLESKILAPIESDGLFRVSLADFDNMSAALQKAEEMKGNYGENIWVKAY